jgi:hypothetical protein
VFNLNKQKYEQPLKRIERNGVAVNIQG